MPAKKIAAQLPSFEVYGPYGSNYGVHALRFTDAANNSFWFSYQTLVAFNGPDGKTVVHVNDWRTTTGKHLNAIDGGSKEAKAARLSDADFKAAFRATFGREVP